MSILDSYFSDSGPGAALAIATDGQEPVIACAGLASIERAARVSRDTMFELASVSKIFTAAAIMRLAEEGQLSIDAAVSDYLPRCVQQRGVRAISIRDLLAHTSDLKDYLADGMHTPPRQMTPRSVMGRLRAWSDQAHPGLAHVYSNTNYVLLAAIIEKASGRSYTQFLSDELFRPLGMKSTLVTVDATSNSQSAAQGYLNVGAGLPSLQPTEALPISTLGDGGVVSSVDDLLRWQAAFWGGRVVSMETLAQMRSPGRLDSGQTFEYGLGLQIQSVNDATWCGHGGSWINATALVGRYVEAQTTVIVLSNEFLAPVERIAQRTYDALLRKPDRR